MIEVEVSKEINVAVQLAVAPHRSLFVSIEGNDKLLKQKGDIFKVTLMQDKYTLLAKKFPALFGYEIKLQLEEGAKGEYYGLNWKIELYNCKRLS